MTKQDTTAEQEAETDSYGRHTVTLGELSEVVKKLAAEEERNISQMVRVLVREALRQRGLIGG